MKNLLLAAAIASAPITANAGGYLHDYCADLAEIAGMHMQMRQQGQPLEDALALANSAPHTIRAVAQQLVVRAYQSPVVHPGLQFDVSLEFAARTYGSCMETGL